MHMLDLPRTSVGHPPGLFFALPLLFTSTTIPVELAAALIEVVHEMAGRSIRPADGGQEEDCQAEQQDQP